MIGYKKEICRDEHTGMFGLLKREFYLFVDIESSFHLILKIIPK